MFVAWGDELTFVYNDAYAPILGVKHPRAMARPFKEVWSDIWPQISPIVDQTMGGVGSWYEDLLIPMERNGYPEEAWFSFSYTPIKVGSTVCGMICAATESTDKVVSARASAFLRELEENLRLLADPLKIIELTQRALGEYLGANRVGYGDVDETERYFTTNDNWTDGQIDHFNGTHDLAGFGPNIHGALKRGEPLTVNDVNDDPRIAGPESQAAFAYLQTRSAMTASLVKDGRMIAAMYIHCRHPRLWTAAEVKIVKDVAERTWSALELAKAQAAQDRSEDRFARFAELSPAIVWFGSGDGSRSYINERWTEFTGQALVETVAMGWMNTLHPNDRPKVLDAWAHAASQGTFEAEARILGKDSSYRWFLLRAKPVLDDDNFWIGFDTDIDDIVRVREELGASRKALEAANSELESSIQARTRDHNRLWRISQELMLIADYEGRITSVNPSAQRILGWAESEMVGSFLQEFLHPDDKAATEAEVGKLGAGQTTLAFENRYRHQDGTYRHLNWTAVPYEGYIHAVGRDVTVEVEAKSALHQAEDALRQSQKMEAVGQLTGGIAHDFNNIIAGISGSLELMSTRLSQGRIGDLDRYVNAASGAAKRAAGLTQRLLAFSRRQTLDPKATNLNTLVNGMMDLINRSMGPEIAVEIAGATGLWTTLVDAGQLENALLNLCINARDAMPEGGKLTIETANRWMDDHSARQHAMAPGQYVSLCVSDTGTGMAPEVVQRAFDPFYTTKPIGQGTGLGLSMVYGFAGQSGGAVRIYSEVGEGTMVCIYLPRHSSDVPAEEAELAASEMPRATGETILLVDDEPLVRMVASEALEELNYIVIEAADGISALKILESKRHIDLLITDVGLPGGMNGRQVAEAARTSRPGLGVLFITGYAENAVLNHGHLDQGMHVLTKPFQMDVFARRVKDLIEQA
jgi:PAS domain S-box-containing protein